MDAIVSTVLPSPPPPPHTCPSNKRSKSSPIVTM